MSTEACNESYTCYDESYKIFCTTHNNITVRCSDRLVAVSIERETEMMKVLVGLAVIIAVAAAQRTFILPINVINVTSPTNNSSCDVVIEAVLKPSKVGFYFS